MAKQRTIAKDFSGLSIDGLIGGPLVAAARANSMMAIEQVKFIMEYCFEEDNNGHHPRMITMTLTRSFFDTNIKNKEDLEIKQVTTTFTLPLITIIPISSLAVESMEINFEMEVKSQFSYYTNNNPSKGADDKEGNDQKNKPGFFSQLPKRANKETVIKGVVSGTSKGKSSNESNGHYDKSESSKLLVNIKAGNLPLPVGLKSIIDIFSKSIEPTEVKKN